MPDTSVSAETHGIGTLSWGIILVLVAASILIAFGMPLGVTSIIISLGAVLFAFTYPYAMFGIMVVLLPFFGFTIRIPTGEFAIGEHAFGGSIDIYLGEVVAFALLIAFALKVILLWGRRHDVNWKPWLPLLLPVTGIVLTHLVSAFSPLRPDMMLVVKYTLRPVLWSYLLYVLLTVNMVRSPRRLRMTLALVTATGMFAAFMGFVSLWLGREAGELIPRARPLPLFGLHPIGENHNLLAEWLAVTVPFTIALSYLVKQERTRRYLAAAAVFQAVIALLTFARSFWIVFAVEAILFAVFVWREELRRYASAALIALVLLLPLGFAMIAFSSTPIVQSSTSTRLMLTEIALNTWFASPWIGAGAGTFVDVVGSTSIFVTEYGNPLDSHGWLQKLLAEVGMLGTLAVAWLIASVFYFVRDHLKTLHAHPVERRVFLILAIALLGALVYQLFNTNYWTGKLWFPLGVLLAASRALISRHERNPEPIHDS